MFKIKPEVRVSDLCAISPYLGIVFYTGKAYADQNKLPWLVTSIWSDGDNIKRKSRTHEDRRAIDVSTRGWDKLHCERLKHYLNKRFGVEWGSRPINSNVIQRVCVYGDEKHLTHMHLQVRSSISLTDLD